MTFRPQLAPDVRSKLEGFGAQLIANTPQEFAAQLKRDYAATAAALQPLGIKLDE